MPADDANATWPAATIAQANALLTQPGSPLEIAPCEINGVEIQCYKNAPATLRDILVASRDFGARDFSGL